MQEQPRRQKPYLLQPPLYDAVDEERPSVQHKADAGRQLCSCAGHRRQPGGQARRHGRRPTPASTPSPRAAWEPRRAEERVSSARAPVATHTTGARARMHARTRLQSGRPARMLWTRRTTRDTELGKPGHGTLALFSGGVVVVVVVVVAGVGVVVAPLPGAGCA